MANRATTSMDAKGLDLKLTYSADKVGFSGSAVLSISQLATALNTTVSGKEGEELFVLSIVLGLLFFVWFNSKWPKTKRPAYIFVASTLLAMAIMLGPAIARIIPGLSITPVYYMKVLTFEDANGDGLRNGTEKMLADIPVRLLDVKFLEERQSITGSDGSVTFFLRNPGQFSVRVCGQTQTHTVSPTARSKEAAEESSIFVAVVDRTVTCK